jgi:hypothetical protein
LFCLTGAHMPGPVSPAPRGCDRKILFTYVDKIN